MQAFKEGYELNDPSVLNFVREFGDSPWSGSDLQAMVRDSKKEVLAVTALSVGTAAAFAWGGPVAAVQAGLCLLKVQTACPAGAPQPQHG